LNYANGNTFVGLDTESNTTYGVYIDSTYENSFCGGYSENNTSGGIYLTTNAARVHYFGRRTIDTTTGTFTGIGNFFTSDNFSVQPNGNLFCGALQTAGNIQLQGTNITVNAGSTTPVGNVAAYMGSLYLQTNGSMWLKTSGLGTDNTGWTQVTIP
jgi:hypothetical protein